MGWWGYDIMEGDTPLDCQGDIVDFLADPELVEKYNSDEGDWQENMDAMYDSAYEALKTEANVINVMKAIQDGELCSYDTNIAMQVLGEMILCSGGAFPQEVRAACVAAAEAEIEYDEGGWKEEGARVEALKAYIARVWAYNGEAVEPTSKGLFATIAEGMAEGDSGLINV